MRRILALILMMLLLPLPLAAAENAPEAAAPAPTLSPEEWASQNLPYERVPSHIEIVPWEIYHVHIWIHHCHILFNK